MEIGKEEKTIIVKDVPSPAETPIEAPVEEPVVVPEREKVPA